MTAHYEAPHGGPDPREARLLADLEALYATPVPSHLRASLAGARRWDGAQRAPRRRLAAVAGALALALGGAGYLTRQSATPASAQTILNRVVAASRLTPQQVAHLTYAFSPHVPGRGGGLAGPLDLWLQTDARGTTRRLAITMTIDRAGAVAAVTRIVVDGGAGQEYTYDPHTGQIAFMSFNGSLSGGAAPFVLDPAAVEAALLKAARGGPGGLRLLPRQTLDGVTVDVLQIPGNPRQGQVPMTAYVDARTYLLRGLDEVAAPTLVLRMRVTAYSVVAASAVPARTFDLNAPASARTVPSVPIPEFVPGD